jgi:SAM-dependent methyltransferase
MARKKNKKDFVCINHKAQEANISHVIAKQDDLFYHIEHPDCVSYKLTAEPLKYLAPFLDPKKKWLTVGDYNGLEANYLLQKGQQVTASDISDAVLKKAHAAGLIKKFSKQNVEHLGYRDNAFDYVICKEAFHHFPRAYLGLYEMIRVSKTAAILVTEPIDILSKMSLVVFIKNILDKIDPLLINKFWKNRFSWETVGNYVFKISEREIEKIAMGMGLPCIAFKRFDHFVSHTPIDGMMDVPFNQELYSRIKRKLRIRSFISKIGVIPHGSICTVIFKERPNGNILQGMKELGFTVLPLPPNPYLK